MKRKKRMKRGIALALVLTFSTMILFQVQAAISIDTERQCSVTFELDSSYPELKELTIPVHLYQAADVNEYGEYQMREGFEKEELSVTNSGSIDSFVRMVITKYWQDADGTKDTKLSPDLIRLNCLTDNGWVMDEKASTPERTILYYTNLLTPGETTPSLSDTLQIDAAVSRKVKETITKEDENGYQTIETVYEYDGYRFYIEAEADAVQTHNAQEAIKSAWGVDVEVSEDGKTIRLR